ncbi:MAG: hypothetical protein QM791_19100 [Ferruginibacter sp.]
MKRSLSIIILLITVKTALSQNAVQAEYFIDTDYGVGNNTLITLNNPQADGTYSFNADLSGLSLGYHKLYIRVKETDGKWSLTTRRNIEVISSNTNKIITGAEYFFDTDPGFSNAQPATVSPQNEAILQNFPAITKELSKGYHKLYIRVRDIDGKWSITARKNVEIIKAEAYVVAGAEYFFNTDPGAGAASQVIFPSTAADSSFTFKIPLSQIPVGAQTLYIRVRDSVNNNWSITQWEKDSVITSSGLDTVWSHPATWSNNKVPDSNTVVILRHKVYVDIATAVCRSLAPYRNDAQCIIWPNMKLSVVGWRKP